jgi:hypothetical protein
MAGDADRELRALRAYGAYLTATLAYSRYLRARGRLGDRESRADITALQAELDRLNRLLGRRARASRGATLALPVEPADRLTRAARRQLDRYREAVCADADRLRTASAVLVQRARQARLARAAAGPAGPDDASEAGR